MLKEIQESVEYIQRKTNIKPIAGIILGTGLGGLVDVINIKDSLPYKDIPNFPVSTVEGHSGNLIFGELNGKEVVAMQGRFHYYEGYDMKQVTFPVRVLYSLGIGQLLISNAAGGIHQSFDIGELMVITDHINLFPENPLRGPNENKLGLRFPDMSEPYNLELIRLADKKGKELGIKLHHGIYIGNPGPSFETKAEYTYYNMIGGSAVGMSTVPEVIVAAHMNLPVLAISVITNIAVEGNFQKNSHIDVQDAAELAAKNLSELFKAIVGDL